MDRPLLGPVFVWRGPMGRRGREEVVTEVVMEVVTEVVTVVTIVTEVPLAGCGVHMTQMTVAMSVARTVITPTTVLDPADVVVEEEEEEDPLAGDPDLGPTIADAVAAVAGVVIVLAPVPLLGLLAGPAHVPVAAAPRIKL